MLRPKEELIRLLSKITGLSELKYALSRESSMLTQEEIATYWGRFLAVKARYADKFHEMGKTDKVLENLEACLRRALTEYERESKAERKSSSVSKGKGEQGLILRAALRALTTEEVYRGSGWRNVLHKKRTKDAKDAYFDLDVEGYGRQRMTYRELLAWFWLAASDRAMPLSAEKIREFGSPEIIINLSINGFFDCLYNIRRAHNEDYPEIKNHPDQDAPSCGPGTIGRILSNSSTMSELTVSPPTVKAILEVIDEFVLNKLELLPVADRAMLFRYFQNKYILFGANTQEDEQHLSRLFKTIKSDSTELFVRLGRYQPSAREKIITFQKCIVELFHHSVDHLTSSLMNHNTFQKIMKIGAKAAIRNEGALLVHTAVISQVAKWLDLRCNLTIFWEIAIKDMMRALLFPTYLSNKDVSQNIVRTFAGFRDMLFSQTEMLSRELKSPASFFEIFKSKITEIGEAGDIRGVEVETEIRRLCDEYHTALSDHITKFKSVSDKIERLLLKLVVLSAISIESQVLKSESSPAPSIQTYIFTHLSPFLEKTNDSMRVQDYSNPGPKQWAKHFIQTALQSDSREVKWLLDFLIEHLRLLYRDATLQQHQQFYLTIEQISTQLEILDKPTSSAHRALDLLKEIFAENGFPIEHCRLTTSLLPGSLEWQDHVLRELDRIPCNSRRLFDINTEKANLMHKIIVNTFCHKFNLAFLRTQDSNIIKLLCQYYLAVISFEDLKENFDYTENLPFLEKALDARSRLVSLMKHFLDFFDHSENFFELYRNGLIILATGKNAQEIIQKASDKSKSVFCLRLLPIPISGKTFAISYAQVNGNVFDFPLSIHCLSEICEVAKKEGTPLQEALSRFLNASGVQDAKLDVWYRAPEETSMPTSSERVIEHCALASKEEKREILHDKEMERVTAETRKRVSLVRYHIRPTMPEAKKIAPAATTMRAPTAAPNHAPLFVAESQGFFKEEGLDVDLLDPADPMDPPKVVAAIATASAAIKRLPAVATATVPAVGTATVLAVATATVPSVATATVPSVATATVLDDLKRTMGIKMAACARLPSEMKAAVEIEIEILKTKINILTLLDSIKENDIELINLMITDWSFFRGKGCERLIKEDIEKEASLGEWMVKIANTHCFAVLDSLIKKYESRIFTRPHLEILRRLYFLLKSHSQHSLATRLWPCFPSSMDERFAPLNGEAFYQIGLDEPRGLEKGVSLFDSYPREQLLRLIKQVISNKNIFLLIQLWNIKPDAVLIFFNVKYNFCNAENNCCCFFPCSCQEFSEYTVFEKAIAFIEYFIEVSPDVLNNGKFASVDLPGLFHAMFYFLINSKQYLLAAKFYDKIPGIVVEHRKTFLIKLLEAYEDNINLVYRLASRLELYSFLNSFDIVVLLEKLIEINNHCLIADLLKKRPGLVEFFIDHKNHSHYIQLFKILLTTVNDSKIKDCLTKSRRKSWSLEEMRSIYKLFCSQPKISIELWVALLQHESLLTPDMIIDVKKRIASLSEIAAVLSIPSGSTVITATSTTAVSSSSSSGIISFIEASSRAISAVSTMLQEDQHLIRESKEILQDPARLSPRTISPAVTPVTALPPPAVQSVTSITTAHSSSTTADQLISTIVAANSPSTATVQSIATTTIANAATTSSSSTAVVSSPTYAARYSHEEEQLRISALQKIFEAEMKKYNITDAYHLQISKELRNSFASLADSKIEKAYILLVGGIIYYKDLSNRQYNRQHFQWKKSSPFSIHLENVVSSLSLTFKEQQTYCAAYMRYQISKGIFMSSMSMGCS